MNLEINKDIYMLTNMDTNNKIEEEEQEETLANLSPEKKNKKGKRFKFGNNNIKLCIKRDNNQINASSILQG